MEESEERSAASRAGVQPQAATRSASLHVGQLRQLAARPASSLASWSDEELTLFPRLFRAASSTLARLEADEGDPRRRAETRRVLADAHARLHDDRPPLVTLPTRLVRWFLVECPRAIRAEWRLLVASALVLYGLAGLAWWGVARDLDLAPSLLDPQVVEQEIEALRAVAPGEAFRGNFTFGIGSSPSASGFIMGNNLRVSALFFASALVPPLYLYILGMNSLMLGTYTGVAGHWGQAGSISSFLWCHGVLEIQAILLAGAAGLTLVRAWLRPGARTRAGALAHESRRALCLLAPVLPMLFCAGLIEGYVTPHAPTGVRLLVAVASGLALVAFALSGRRARPSAAAPAATR